MRLLPKTPTPAAARPARPARRGATAVEMALVISIFLMFLFGIFEYCRYIFILQIATNASREGARYAVVRASDPTVAFSVHPSQALPHEPAADPSRKKYRVPVVEDFVVARMGGVAPMITDFKLRVFVTDNDRLFEVPSVIVPKANATSWKGTRLPERVAVQIAGTYRPIVPSLLFMDQSIPMNIVSVMGCEG